MELKYKSIFKDDIHDMLLYEKAMNFKRGNKIALYDLDCYFSKINKRSKNITEDEFDFYIYKYNESTLNTYQKYLIISLCCSFWGM